MHYISTINLQSQEVSPVKIHFTEGKIEAQID